MDNVSGITADTASATDNQLGDDDDDDDDDDEGRRVTDAASHGNFELVLRILGSMCDGQYTDLQASSFLSFRFVFPFLTCLSVFSRVAPDIISGPGPGRNPPVFFQIRPNPAPAGYDRRILGRIYQILKIRTSLLSDLFF